MIPSKDRVGSSVAIWNLYGTQDIQIQPHVDPRSGEKSNPDAVEPKAGKADSIVINTGDEGNSHHSIANTSEAEGITSVEGPNAAKVSVSNAPDSVREVVEEEVQPTAADGRFKKEGSDDLERVASASRVDDGTGPEKSSESGNEMGISPSTGRMNSREGDGPTEIIVNNESSGEGAMSKSH
ncbi:hypothetical protein Pmar_PMAR017971 [Perkinsus marinus ATCC 50983]|uniref:Uncharacterized protein n=1 Tax=Perkinsus marinus (strain ATCC 50983 / TXsc) TaxID=423536 RepID=C5LR94_PERM5|nr:hypothetical protein Pmar_PMAR017971 [Perkinsus marinus ATCC 50983]EER00749.1 hypothetical protein Pmar_PMAR017971 [Perkinsus marinus ATCC 50983]|eukprot:XP_002768031.1 hypothetical protein Pmar_PMAR017971 [Perkinsus marinus ATCC 50983]